MSFDSSVLFCVCRKKVGQNLQESVLPETEMQHVDNTFLANPRHNIYDRVGSKQDQPCVDEATINSEDDSSEKLDIVTSL